MRGQIIDLALELPELSPRELAVRFIAGVRFAEGIKVILTQQSHAA
ncbi:hypothetical protein M2226_009561 [Bradyrhizobium elkanii]|nr:hypothetical protein [Bradyrhizobium elkanii]MCW2175918.1 hypothetical protein [Bradyrhizobium elkanii]